MKHIRLNYSFLLCTVLHNRIYVNTEKKRLKLEDGLTANDTAEIHI